jgi:hypothetical protein
MARKSFFYCHRRFLPLNHPFRSDKRFFLKGKTIRKEPPKRKFGVDNMKTLDDMKESEMVCSKDTVKITTGLIKVAIENTLIEKH